MKGKKVYTYLGDKLIKIEDYNRFGCLKYSKDYRTKIEEFRNYNSDGKVIFCKNSNGLQVSYEYDNNGNCISIKRSDGTFELNQYDIFNNKIYTETELCKQHMKYCRFGVVNIKNSSGWEMRHTYNNKGQLLKTEFENDKKEVEFFEYDSNGNMIHRYSNRYEAWYSYKNGNLIHVIDSLGNEESYKYDDKGNCIFHSSEIDEYYKYDKEGNEIEYSNSIGVRIESVYA